MKSNRIIFMTACSLPILFAVVMLGESKAVAQTPSSVDVTVTQTELDEPAGCSGSFVAHDLDFVTGARVRDISTYLSNGAGVAANDLDGDGDLDLVFASVDRESEILWNLGDLSFEAETLDDSLTRGVSVVDVDGDGLLDVTFTHRGLEGVSFWRNQGPNDGQRPSFARQALPGVDAYAYALAWGDLNNDGLLDLVTGSYGAELKQRGIDGPQDDGSTGIILHTQQVDGSFLPQVLDPDAEALSIGLVDMTGDGQPEIWVANDFAMHDRVWQRNTDGWSLIEPFTQTSHSTMSLTWGDTRNRQEQVYFTTDMAPYDTSPEVMAQWQPLMEAMGMGSMDTESMDMHSMDGHHEEGDPQVMSNVLQMPSFYSGPHNQAYWRGVEATGWSWASRFGDLDSDGFLDLYIVNGVIASDMFGHLHNNELVEENQAFRNRGSGSFVKAPEWNLGSTASGRGMIMADMDGDGDLDIVVNNMRSSAQLLENQLCEGGNLLIDLRWEGIPNSHAIGALLTLHTANGTLSRDMHASGGYLSGDPAQVHFGLPGDSPIESLEIQWPDGQTSSIDAPVLNRHLTITRNDTSNQ